MSDAATRPILIVLAGVNGAGKSSLIGALLSEHEIGWFNPDAYARALIAEQGVDEHEALLCAWEYGHAQLEVAIATQQNYAFETTLGGETIPALIAQAAATHDIFMLYCGLSSAEQHIERVRLRVQQGGHAIPEQKIHERWDGSRTHLIQLLPFLDRLQVFDNSAEALLGDGIPDPRLVLKVQQQRVAYPDIHDPDELEKTPAWARPIVQAAIQIHLSRTGR